MSGLTNYTSGGVDLSYIFQPYVSGATASATGYKLSNGNDLSNIFAKYVATGPTAGVTGYTVGGIDISNRFVIKDPFTTTSTYSYIFDASNNYIVIVTSAGSFNFIKTVKSLQLVILGGGGGGGGGIDVENVNGNGYGGAGGAQAILSYNDTSFNSLNKTFTISNIASGGTGGLYNIYGGSSGATGGTTIVSDPSSNIYTLTGGQGGDVNQAYIAQSGTCTVSPSNPSYAALTTGTGGNGGGYYGNGQNSYLYTSGNNLITYLGLGGGGGGGEGGYGGSAQGNGKGGSASGRGTTTASGYGAGGGSCFQFANGGNGTPGVVVFYFKYP